MKKLLFILMFAVCSLNAAPTYTVKEIKKILDASNKVDAIVIVVTVTIDGESLDGGTFLLPDARAAVLADSSKYKEYCEKLAAETELRLIKKRANIKEEKIDPATVTIDPAKVAVEKDKL